MGWPATSGKFTYVRHEPEKTLLYQVMQEHLETWLAERQADTARSRLPSFVEKELRAFMQCGILSHGFILLACDACPALLPVAYSCKKRGFCPSCGAKRMAETTAHLIDNVLPHVPMFGFPAASVPQIFENDCNLTPTGSSVQRGQIRRL